jgi:hypothetical protein
VLLLRQGGGPLVVDDEGLAKSDESPVLHAVGRKVLGSML